MAIVIPRDNLSGFFFFYTVLYMLYTSAGSPINNSTRLILYNNSESKINIIMTLQFQITYSQEFNLYDLLTLDISTPEPTFLRHNHFGSLPEVHQAIHDYQKEYL